jgi:hypothetical protein
LLANLILIAIKFRKESTSTQLLSVRLGGNLNLAKMLCLFVLIYAVSVTANFDNTCSLTSNIDCRGPEHEYTSMYSEGKEAPTQVSGKVSLVI